MAFNLKDADGNVVAVKSQETIINENFSLKRQAEDRLIFIRSMYAEQLNGIPKKMQNRKIEMIASWIAFGFILFLIYMLIMMYGLIGVVVSCWIIFWIFITSRDCFHATLRYMVLCKGCKWTKQVMPNRFTTYEAEAAYCRSRIHELNKEIEKLPLYKGDELKKNCERILELEYDERRASFRSGNEDSRLI